MPQDAQPRLSVVIPIYNEEKTILDALERIEAYRAVKGQSWEIIVADDGSTDRTAALVKEFIRSRALSHVRLISYDHNRGKGHAARIGMTAATAENVLMTDVDLSTPIKEVDKLVNELERGADVAIGSRAKRARGADVRQSFKRALSGRIFNLIVKLFVLRGLDDTQCGFKCFRRKAALDLFGAQKLDGFSFDVEVLYLARKKGYRIAEVPVMWSQGEHSKVDVFRDSFRMTGDLFRIKALHG